MNRTFMSTFLPAAFLTVFSIIVALPAANASAIGLSGPAKGPSCKTSVIDRLGKDSVFLSASNNLYTMSVRRTFQGCWTYWPSGPCRAIYSDSRGNYYICGECDDFGNPGGGECSSISSSTINMGYWCS